MKKFLLPLAALTLLAAGCGSAGSGSCTVSNAGFSYCINYSGSSYTTSAVQAVCTPAVGTYSSGACATGGAGVCTFQKGTSTEYKWTFANGDAGAGVSLETTCTAAGGSFSAT
jgi:hypothetical protein